MSLDVPACVIDFEGRPDSGAAEYGLVVIDDGRITETATRLCRPAGAIRDEDARLHGIRDADVAGMSSFAEERERFAALRKRAVFCAHNASVEAGILKSYWPYPPYCPDFSSADGREAAEWGPWLDTRRLCAIAYPSLGSCKLQDLAHSLGVMERIDSWAEAYCPKGRRKWHCALYDALASAALLLRLLEEPGYDRATAQWLLRVSAGETGQQQAELF